MKNYFLIMKKVLMMNFTSLLGGILSVLETISIFLGFGF